MQISGETEAIFLEDALFWMNFDLFVASAVVLSGCSLILAFSTRVVVSARKNWNVLMWLNFTRTFILKKIVSLWILILVTMYFFLVLFYFTHRGMITYHMRNWQTWGADRTVKQCPKTYQGRSTQWPHTWNPGRHDICYSRRGLKPSLSRYNCTLHIVL